MAASKAFESWDDDLELEGPILTNSVSTYQNSFSSRLSLRSESNAGDDDWNVSLAANDDQSTTHAINSAKLAGIPIPSNVPASALLGGTIKKLGQKKSPRPQKDDWDHDMDFGDDLDSPLTLKKRETTTPMHQHIDEDDDFDWAEGSLGIRNGGTRNASRTISTSFRIGSPSLGSVKTVESEEDGTGGLLLPSGPMDFEAALKKRKETTPIEQSDPFTRTESTSRPTSKHDRDDSFDDIDFGPGDIFDPRKRTVNRNLKHKFAAPDKPSPVQKSQTTITFNDKATNTRIPRPVPPPTRPARLEPVMESGATNITRARPGAPAAANAQMLRSKRSAPALRQQQPVGRPPPMPSLPPSMAAQQRTSQARISPYGFNRRDSDPNRPQSPTMRAHSRLSHAITPDTPTRPRRDVAPAALAREAAAKRQVTRPARRRNFGDGTELDGLDDLPTSASKESLFLKQPTGRGPPRSLRPQPSQSKLGLRDKMTTPMPPATPKSPTKAAENLPRFARDTAASRIAREQTIGGPAKPQVGGPLMNRTNQSTTNLLRTPQTSPAAKRTFRKGPTLVAPMGKENIRHWEDDAAKKGMKWNAVMYRWEGNEKAIQGFDPPPPPSPPRPALITNFGQPAGASGALVSGNMVFDNQAKRWLKLGTAMSDPRSPSVGDDDDPFRDIEDLKDETASTAGAGNSGGGAVGESFLGEEFDVGPAFVQRQKEEEALWRERIGAWFGDDRLREGEQYKWTIRDIAANALL